MTGVIKDKKAVLSQGRPRDAAVNLARYVPKFTNAQSFITPRNIWGLIKAVGVVRSLMPQSRNSKPKAESWDMVLWKRPRAIWSVGEKAEMPTG